VLIISPDKFNQTTRLPVILPITSGGNFARAAGYSVVLTGTRTTGIVRCDQPRVLDLAERVASSRPFLRKSCRKFWTSHSSFSLSAASKYSNA
jgi:mRNA-degrading endonuclease toxin of MazEF toxin-antitoxin module